eukprot:2962812-Amphidinium_carterae.2
MARRPVSAAVDGMLCRGFAVRLTAHVAHEHACRMRALNMLRKCARGAKEPQAFPLCWSCADARWWMVWGGIKHPSGGAKYPGAVLDTGMAYVHTWTEA